MTKPIDRLLKLFEIGSRNSKVDAKRIQAMHDTSVDLGAECSAMSESFSDFTTNDVMTLLQKALRSTFKEKYPYAYVSDLFEDSVVFAAGYNGEYYRSSYDVTEDGKVTLGDPTPVIRKVQYIDDTSGATPPVLGTTESASELTLDNEVVPLVESADLNLSEATRVVKLIAPGWGSSGYYPADVLKRDGPTVFRKGMHNFWDHPTAIEERERPEGSLSKVASVLVEDATWHDDYKGNGPGLYAKAKINTQYEKPISDLAENIGMSIRASGKAVLGEREGRKGPIIEAITQARSVDYVTIPGAGGKVLELFEAAKQPVVIKESGDQAMADAKVSVDVDSTKLQETIAAFNRKMLLNEARTHVREKLTGLRVRDAIRNRVMADVMAREIPVTESGDLDVVAFDKLIETAMQAELDYLSEAGNLGKITGFGNGKAVETDKIEDLQKEFNEALKQLD